MLEKEKDMFIIIGSEDYNVEMNNLQTFIKQFDKKSVVINSFSELGILLSSYNKEQSSKVVIFNFYYYISQFDIFFNSLSSETYKDDLTIISYFMELEYTSNNPSITSNTYIITQYLENHDEFKLKNVLKDISIDNTIYLTYLSLYLSNYTISLFYLKDVNQLSYKMERMVKSSKYLINNIKYLNNNFILPYYIVKVKDGSITEEYNLNCDSYIYINDLWYNPDKKVCNNGKEEKINFIEIGYMGKNKHLHYYTILRGIYESIDYTNSKQLLSLNYILKIIIAPYSFSITEQYRYLLSSNKTTVIIYYKSTDMLDDLLPIINDKDPYLFTLGYNSGEICFPNIFHIGTNIPTQIHYYNYYYPNKSLFLLYSNTPYNYYIYFL